LVVKTWPVIIAWLTLPEPSRKSVSQGPLQKLDAVQEGSVVAQMVLQLERVHALVISLSTFAAAGADRPMPFARG
jgi:hypothetical protein